MKKTRKAIDGLTKEQLDQVFASFFQEQPLLLEFVVRLSGHRDRIHELVMHLLFFVFKAYEAEYGRQAVTNRQDFVMVFDQATSWMDEFLNPDGDYPLSLVETEPFLMTYVGETLLEKPLEDGTQYTAKEQHDILSIVKIVMLACDRAARRRNAQGN